MQSRMGVTGGFLALALLSTQSFAATCSAIDASGLVLNNAGGQTAAVETQNDTRLTLAAADSSASIRGGDLGLLMIVPKEFDNNSGASSPLNASVVDADTSLGYQRADSGVISIDMLAGQETQLVFPTSVLTDSLSNNAAGHTFWDGSKINAINLNSTFLVKVTLTVVPWLIQGNLDIKISPSLTGSIPNEDARAIAVDAGSSQQITFSFPVGVQAAFLASGGLIWLEPDVPVTITHAFLSFYPWSVP